MFKDLIRRTTLNRQLDDDHKLQRMLDNADFLYTAWDGAQPVGFVRGLSDYGDVTYVADLGVDQNYWRQGIGKQLLALIDRELGTGMHTVLLASELAADYYAKVGFTKDPRGYIKNPTAR
jgi:GNAT superfamily N-acetyltransferase